MRPPTATSMCEYGPRESRTAAHIETLLHETGRRYRDVLARLWWVGRDLDRLDLHSVLGAAYNRMYRCQLTLFVGAGQVDAPQSLTSTLSEKLPSETTVWSTAAARARMGRATSAARASRANMGVAEERRSIDGARAVLVRTCPLSYSYTSPWLEIIAVALFP